MYYPFAQALGDTRLESEYMESLRYVNYLSILFLYLKIIYHKNLGHFISK